MKAVRVYKVMLAHDAGHEDLFSGYQYVNGYELPCGKFVLEGQLYANREVPCYEDMDLDGECDTSEVPAYDTTIVIED